MKDMRRELLPLFGRGLLLKALIFPQNFGHVCDGFGVRWDTVISIDRRRAGIVSRQRQARVAMISQQQSAQIFCAAHRIFGGNTAVYAEVRRRPGH